MIVMQRMKLMNKSYILCLVLIFVCTGVNAKSGVIPTYRSFACWMSDKDTLYHENRSMLLESASGDGSVIVRVRHQDWDNTVSNEKKDNCLAPWHDCISRFTGIRGIVQHDKSFVESISTMPQWCKLKQNVQDILMMSDIENGYNMPYNSEFMIQNTTDHEMMITDINRGLFWFIPSRCFLIIDMGNLPQVAYFRISSSDPKYNDVKYLTLGTGSFSMKYTIAYEDEDYWVFVLNEEYIVRGTGHDFTGLLGLDDRALRTHYIKCDKDTFEQTEMKEKDVFALLKKK